MCFLGVTGLRTMEELVAHVDGPHVCASPNALPVLRVNWV